MQTGFIKISKQLEDLPDEIYKILEGKSLYDVSIVDRFGDSLRDILHKRLKQEDREATLRMSNVGKPLRQLYYELRRHEKEKISGKTLLKFAYGDLCEALLIVLAEAAGYKAERFQEEVEVDSVLGHIDLVLEGVLIDVKSCSSYSFNKFKSRTIFDEGQDSFGYIGQICGYAHALKLPAAWIAMDKTSGEVCVCRVPQELIDNYDVRKRIQEVRAAINLDVEPARCYEDQPDGKSGNRKIHVGCSYCGYKWNCWRDANGGKGLQVYNYASGPRFLSVVKKEPKVNQKEDWYEFSPAEQKPAESN